jgi:hypothetical protein
MDAPAPPKKTGALLQAPINKKHYRAQHKSGRGRAQVLAERKRLNGYRLAALLQSDRLSPWERRAVRELSRRAQILPEQQKLLDRLYAECLEEEAP